MKIRMNMNAANELLSLIPTGLGWRVRRELWFAGHNIIAKFGTRINVMEGANLEIGEGTTIGEFTDIRCGKSLSIGSGTIIAQFVGITDTQHNPDNHSITTNNDTKQVRIGKNCWIGMKATILKGAGMGDNSTLGANSVLTKRMPNNEIWAGNPAKLIRKVRKWTNTN